MQLISICKSGLVSRVGPGMPQQGPWPWPRPLAGKRAGAGVGGGEVRAQTSPDTCPVLGLVGASSTGPRLPGPACPVGLWERGQQGCQGMGGHCYARALVGSDSSWLLGVFGARYLIGPCWLAAIFLFRSGRDGSPCAYLVPPTPPGGGKGP